VEGRQGAGWGRPNVTRMSLPLHPLVMPVIVERGLLTSSLDHVLLTPPSKRASARGSFSCRRDVPRA